MKLVHAQKIQQKRKAEKKRLYTKYKIQTTKNHNREKKSELSSKNYLFEDSNGVTSHLPYECFRHFNT